MGYKVCSREKVCKDFFLNFCDKLTLQFSTTSKYIYLCIPVYIYILDGFEPHSSASSIILEVIKYSLCN